MVLNHLAAGNRLSYLLHTNSAKNRLVYSVLREFKLPARKFLPNLLNKRHLAKLATTNRVYVPLLATSTRRAKTRGFAYPSHRPMRKPTAETAAVSTVPQIRSMTVMSTGHSLTVARFVRSYVA